MKNNKKIKLKRGITLLETFLSLILALIIVGSVLYYYSQANTIEKGQEAYQEIIDIKSLIKQITQGKTGYDGISTKVLARSTLLNNKYVNGDGIYFTPATGGYINIVPNWYNNGMNQVLMDFQGQMSKEICYQLATKDFGDDVDYIEIQGHGMSGKASANERAQACNGYSWKAMSIVFH